MSRYTDTAQCPKGHRFTVQRRAASAGFIIDTHCEACKKNYQITAGPVPNGAAPARKLAERDIEARLVKRVQEMGGEVRKVQWVGRVGAPDRLVMLPGGFELPWGLHPQTIWVEIKAPGKAANFPANAHERAQHREHERMRRMGQRVVVVDSYEQIEELLK